MITESGQTLEGRVDRIMTGSRHIHTGFGDSLHVCLQLQCSSSLLSSDCSLAPRGWFTHHSMSISRVRRTVGQ